MSNTMIHLARTIAPGLCLTLLVTSSALAQTHLYSLHGKVQAARTGFAVAGLGDINNDGHADVAIGKPGAAGHGPNTGAVQIVSGMDGAILNTLGGNSAGDEFGWAIANVGDIDKDGTQDFVVGAPFSSPNGFLSGQATVYSGRTSAVLFSLPGGSAREIFGISVGAAGDVNKDGWPDIIVGGHGGTKHGPNTGLARVFSGKTGTLIWRFDGDAATDFFGHSVGGAGDLDKDGHDDLIVGIPDDDNTGINSGAARVFSGKTGAMLFQWNGDTTTDNFGHSVAGVGDVDKDGTPDVIVGAPQFFSTSVGKGYARIFSGKTGSAIRTLRGSNTGDFFSEPVVPAGDLNGDGYADVLIGAHKDDTKATDAGAAFIFSGKDGTKLRSYFGTAAGDHFGYVVRMAGDVNGDNQPDVIFGAPESSAIASGAGMARIESTTGLLLTIDIHEISLAAGGTQTLSIHGGTQNANKLYIVVGGMSGTRPGIPLNGNVVLPLNPDAYLNLTLSNPNTFIQTSIAFLGASGNGTARIALPQGFLPFLAGTSLQHSAVLIDLTKLSVDAASPTTPLRLLQ